MKLIRMAELLGPGPRNTDATPPPGYSPGLGPTGGLGDAKLSDNDDGGQPAANSAQMDKIKRTQEAIEDVKGVMAHNIQAIQERGERLEDLQNKTGESERSRLCVPPCIQLQVPSNCARKRIVPVELSQSSCSNAQQPYTYTRLIPGFPRGGCKVAKR